MWFGDSRAIVRRRPLTRSKTGDLGLSEFVDDAAGLVMLTLPNPADSILYRVAADPRRGKTCGIWYKLGVLEPEEPKWGPAQGSPVEVCALEGEKEKLWVEETDVNSPTQPTFAFPGFVVDS
jgi:hypothetical protein